MEQRLLNKRSTNGRGFKAATGNHCETSMSYSFQKQQTTCSALAHGESQTQNLCAKLTHRVHTSPHTLASLQQHNIQARMSILRIPIISPPNCTLCPSRRQKFKAVRHPANNASYSIKLPPLEFRFQELDGLLLRHADCHLRVLQMAVGGCRRDALRKLRGWGEDRGLPHRHH